MIYEDTIKILEEKGVDFRIHEHEQVLTMEDVERKLPFPKDKLLKTLVFKTCHSFWILAVMKGKDRVNYRKLSRTLGISRQDLLKPSIEELESALGFQIGGICPIPTTNQVRAIFDENVMDMDVVYCGIGRNDRSLEIRLHDLLRVSNALVQSITEEINDQNKS